MGDEASMPVLDVLVEDGEDRVIGAWVEGQGRFPTWSSPTPTRCGRETNNAPLLPEQPEWFLHYEARGIYLYHDEINLNGPVYRMGLIMNEDGVSIDGLSNMLDQGFLFGIGVMEDDTIVAPSHPVGR